MLDWTKKDLDTRHKTNEMPSVHTPSRDRDGEPQNDGDSKPAAPPILSKRVRNGWGWGG